MSYQGNTEIPVWKRVLFSQTLVEKNKSHRIAYIAVMTALIVVANMFFEFKLAETQFSFTLVISALTGIMIGPLCGAAACFLGDLVGFLYNSGGYAYLPWIGISMALVAVVAGLVYALPWRWEGHLFVKGGIVSVVTFLLCTVGINTTAFWLLYSKVSYGTYLISRLFVQGQIWNSLVNYALLFIVVPVLQRVKLVSV
ncbi:MAG: ECF transporter S component [Clostridia bacterium]|nr:ECF transporter S component [Clostridia bacterium]